MDKIATPFPHLKLPDTTEEMIRQNYTIIDLYKMAERFFTSLGLEPMSKYVLCTRLSTHPPVQKMVKFKSILDVDYSGRIVY